MKNLNYVQKDIDFMKLFVPINSFSPTLFREDFWFVLILHLLVHLPSNAFHGHPQFEASLAFRHWLLQLHTFSNISYCPRQNKRTFTVIRSQKNLLYTELLDWNLYSNLNWDVSRTIYSRTNDRFPYSAFLLPVKGEFSWHASSKNCYRNKL